MESKDVKRRLFDILEATENGGKTGRIESVR